MSHGRHLVSLRAGNVFSLIRDMLPHIVDFLKCDKFQHVWQPSLLFLCVFVCMMGLYVDRFRQIFITTKLRIRMQIIEKYQYIQCD